MSTASVSAEPEFRLFQHVRMKPYGEVGPVVEITERETSPWHAPKKETRRFLPEGQFTYHVARQGMGYAVLLNADELEPV